LKKIEIEKHHMVPRHVVLNDEEKNEVLKRYKVTLRQLPRILITDPAIVGKNPQVGDVVKIIRESQTAGETVYYRVVVGG
jgi:DNA-directed RNA polymerase subunit H